jgi:multidrug resistance efflux pump
VEVLQADSDRIDAELELLAEERRQAAAGIFVADGRYGAPYAEMRADEIAITLLDIAARKSEQETRVAQIERQIAEEERRLAKVGSANIVSPHDGVVWRVLTAPGSDLVIGQEVAEVLDCRTTFLEVLVSEGRYNATRVGEKLNYRLVGEDSFQTATVTALRGANAVAADRGLAANLTASRDGQFRVFASFDANAPTATSNATGYCDVGRHAEVRFPTALGNGLRNPLAIIQGLFE